MLASYLLMKWNLFKARFFGDESGAVDLIVIVVLIAIAIVLALVFKDRILGIINDLFDNMSGADEINKVPTQGAGK